jgi:hypothetical protein
VVRQTSQLARCGYTLRVTSQTLYSPEYITQTHTHTHTHTQYHDGIRNTLGIFRLSCTGGRINVYTSVPADKILEYLG